MRLIVVLAAVFQAIITKNINPFPRALTMSTEIEISDTRHSNGELIFVLVLKGIYDCTGGYVVMN